MANFSDFLPAVGGGSSQATTKEIGGEIYNNVYTKPTQAWARQASQYSNYIGVGDTSANDVSWATTNGYQLSPNFYTHALTTSNDAQWNTLADVTGATNGGFLFWVITPNDFQSTIGTQTSVKLTIDGIAYTFTNEITSNTVNTSTNYSMILGCWMGANFWYGWGNSTTASIPSSLVLPKTSYLQYPASSSGYIPIKAGITTTSGSWQTVIPTEAAIYAADLPKLYFENSCKVEYYVNEAYATAGTGYGQAGCLLQTL